MDLPRLYIPLLLGFLVASLSASDSPNLTSLGIPTQTHSHGSGLYPPQLVIDDDLTTFNHTESSTPGAAWELTFPNEQEIGQVDLITRNCCGGRLNGATLRLFDDTGAIAFEINIVDSGPLSLFTAIIPSGTFASRLRIGFEPGESGIVHLAEVDVFGPPADPPEITSFTANPGTLTSGQTSTLSWTTDFATSVELRSIGPVDTDVSTFVNPTESTVYLLTASNDCGTVTRSVGVEVDGIPLLPRITEFSAYPDDWIEIWNPSPAPLVLTNWTLTDNTNEPAKWTFPAGTTIAPGEHLLIDSPFGLAREAGSYLALLDPTGTTTSSFVYPRQTSRGTYGIDLDDNETFFLEPTPGQFNSGPTTRGFLTGVDFSEGRGFFESAFSLTLTPKTAGAQVLVSLDGSDPTIPYTGPIAITSTTVVRAIETRIDFVASRSEAQSYLFLADIANQSQNLNGWPADWHPSGKSGALVPIPRPSDYEMDSSIVNSAPFISKDNMSYNIPDALRDIPTMCLTFPIAEVFDPSDGLHTNSDSRGFDWEREISMEIINPRTGNDFHTGCGFRIHGGRGRTPEMLKKSFRLYFRGLYGATKLEYPLFEGLPEVGADHLVLRAGLGKAYMSPWRSLTTLQGVTYLRDQMVRDSNGAMNQPYFEGGFVHLYLNGVYWGLFNPVERPGGPYAANHFGGDDDTDWDFLKWANGIRRQNVAGTPDAWDEVMDLARAGGVSNYTAIRDRVDIENLADFLITNIWAGNGDWAATGNNGYGFRSRVDTGDPVGDTRFRFMCWDGEETFSDINKNSTEGGRNDDTPMDLHKKLRGGTEYRLTFADRVHKHLVDEDATLNTLNATERYRILSSEIDQAISCESARWGDLLHPVILSTPYTFTRETDWLAANNTLEQTYFTRRPGIALSQLQSDNLYPGTQAPEATLTPGNLLSITAPLGTIYYTTDGSDPRLEGGSISSAAQVYNGGSETNLLPAASNWDYLDNGSSLDAINWTDASYPAPGWTNNQAPFGYGEVTGMTFNTPVSFGGNSQNKHITTYFRATFDISDKDALGQVQMRFEVDDSLVAYLNGNEFTRFNLPQGSITSSTPASTGATEGVVHSLTIPISLLQNGTNTLAVEVHQRSGDSSDLGFDMSIIERSGGLPLAGDALIKTRARNGNEWSALEEELFVFADPGTDLVISEVMYHPSEPTAAEVTAGFDDDDFFEYIELRNIGVQEIVLDGLRFTKGADALLSGSLAPGETAVIVANITAFQLRYGSDIRILGQWETGDKLSNSGENIRLRDRDDEVLLEFEYLDADPWPASADGDGFSLVLVNPFSLPDHTQATSWRTSSTLNGNPGTTDSTLFTGTTGAELLAYATGGESPSIQIANDGTLTLQTGLNQRAEDLVHYFELSSDLINWQSANTILTLEDTTPKSSGHARYTFEIHPTIEDQKLFFRYRTETLP